MNFSSEINKKFRPKLIDEKIKNERIKKIIELEGINKKREIQELNNKLKNKLFQIVNTQPKNFRKNNVFKMSKSVAEQQIIKLQYFKNGELTEIKPIEKNNNINRNKKSYNQIVKDIKSKLVLLNQLIE